MTTIYEAIMKAADHIERFPMLCELTMPIIPDNASTVTCILGRVGMFVGGFTGQHTGGMLCRIESSVNDFLGIDSCDFFTRMKDLGYNRDDKATYAPAMRRYAELYHSDSKPHLPVRLDHIPQSVRAIFDGSRVVEGA